jgi:SAM-dependent methyltransferase
LVSRAGGKAAPWHRGSVYWAGFGNCGKEGSGSESSAEIEGFRGADEGKLAEILRSAFGVGPAGVHLGDAQGTKQCGAQALINRLRDYQAITRNPELMQLHRRLNELLLKATREWESYDYGEGYFYQGLKALQITGLRDTDGRIEAMGLPERVRGKTVLEIGCNTGFISAALAGEATRIVGFDINPHLIEIARESALFLGVGNVEFQVSSFEDLKVEEAFDVVLSFANHSTYDKNTRQGPEAYFDRCLSLLKPGGTLLFESHPPAHEGEGLKAVLEMIHARVDVRECRVLEYGTFLDRGRTFAAGERAVAANPVQPVRA